MNTKKRFIISSLIVLVINIVYAISYKFETNFWNLIYYFYNNPIHIAGSVSLVGVSLILIIKDNLKSSILLRYKGFKDYLKTIYKTYFKQIIFLFILDFFIIVFFSLLNSKLDFSLKYLNYDIVNIIYLGLYLIRYFYYLYLFSLICFYLYYLKKEISYVVVTFFSLVSFFHYHELINTISKMPLLFTDYLEELKFSSIYLEISASIIILLGLFFLIYILERMILKKKYLKMDDYI